MRFERLHQILRGLHWDRPVEAAAWQDLATRAKWRLWHGQRLRTVEALEAIEDDLGPTEPLLAASRQQPPDAAAPRALGAAGLLSR